MEFQTAMYVSFCSVKLKLAATKDPHCTLISPRARNCADCGQNHMENYIADHLHLVLAIMHWVSLQSLNNCGRSMCHKHFHKRSTNWPTIQPFNQSTNNLTIWWLIYISLNFRSRGINNFKMHTDRRMYKPTSEDCVTVKLTAM